MSRRHAAEKREILPDPKFGDTVVTKFMNSLMHDGKKSVAEAIVYGAMDQINKKTGLDPIRVFHDALGFQEVGQQPTDYGAYVSLMTKPINR